MRDQGKGRRRVLSLQFLAWDKSWDGRFGRLLSGIEISEEEPRHVIGSEIRRGGRIYRVVQDGWSLAEPS